MANSLALDLGRLCNQAREEDQCGVFTHTDCKVKAGGSVAFAHKAILAARSAFFSNAFASNMKEMHDSCVTLQTSSESVSKVALHALLRYMYTGEVTEITTDTCWDVLGLLQPLQPDDEDTTLASFLKRHRMPGLPLQRLEEAVPGVELQFLDDNAALRTAAISPPWNSKCKDYAGTKATVCQIDTEKGVQFNGGHWWSFKAFIWPRIPMANVSAESQGFLGLTDDSTIRAQCEKMILVAATADKLVDTLVRAHQEGAHAAGVRHVLMEQLIYNMDTYKNINGFDKLMDWPELMRDILNLAATHLHAKQRWHPSVLVSEWVFPGSDLDSEVSD